MAFDHGASEAMTHHSTVQIDVVCAGNPHEMGFVQGSVLREKIQTAVEKCSQQQAFRLDQPWWLPDPAFMWIAETKAQWMLRRPLERHCPEMHARLIGMAQGAGLGLKTMYLLNAIEPFLGSVRDRSAVPSMAACSAVAVRGTRSATREPIIARNFDYLPFLQPYFTLREGRPRGGYRSVDFTAVMMAGAVDSMNEAGLCITYNYAYTMDDAPRAGTVSMVITEALERCATVTQAADWISARPRWGGGILMLADPSGDIASLELSNTRTRLRRPATGEDMIFHTNQFRTQEMKSIQVSPDAIFTNRAHPAARGRRVLESAERRDNRLDQLLRWPKPLSPDDLTQIMADHGPDNAPSEYTVCVHGTLRSTTACMQYYPASRRIRVDFTSPCVARYHEIQL
jgi:Acyl-coenzyme A:6-aminopenicillanic acid acyl-transferase